MSALTYGSPLTVVSRQNVMPVVRGLTGEVLGFYPIAATDYAGTETTLDVTQGAGTVTVPITTVTMPKRIDDGSGYGVPQYMASVLDESTFRTNQYKSLSAFVDSSHDGASSKWIQPSTGAQSLVTRGVITTSLLVTMNAADTTAPTTAPVTANATATMNWTAGIQTGALQDQCSFFDFSWVTLFNAKSGSKAVSIEVTSNPAGGYFKSTIVPIPVVGATGGVIYNTVRVVKLKPVPAGAYVFVYKVKDDANTTTTCTLTLTVTQ